MSRRRKRLKRRERPVRASLAAVSLRLALFFFGLAAGLLGPWIWWLDREAGLRFAERQWSQASRVYARALELHPGRPLHVEDLEQELIASGLRRGDPRRVGAYSVAGSRFDIHPPGFAHPDGVEPARRVLVVLSDGRLASLSDAAGQALGLVRLPPAELGSLLPLDDRDRTLVALADFPPLLVTGVQAVEDRQFKHHHGLDPRGMLRAAWSNLRYRRVVQGGSTITQQLVKNLFLTPDRSLVRKFNEGVMALSLERRFGKAEILEAYLNEVYLGQDGRHAIHGFGRASEYYFGLPVQALAPDQVALLVGMVRGASWYNPVRNPERALARRNRVLDMFLETGLIDQASHRSAVESALGIERGHGQRVRRHWAFLDLVQRQLRRDYRERDLRGAGLRIFTTLDPVAQLHAERALAEQLPRVESEPGSLQGAIVLIDPAGGEVRAVVGDRLAGRAGFNRALDARRPVGSVIKPFVYLLALADSERFSLVTPLADEPISIPQPGGEPWQPRNIDGRSHGQVPLMTALANSYNQASVRLGLEVGAQALLDLLAQLGVRPDSEPHPAIFLGAMELTPLQVAQLYQPLAAEGYSTPLRAISAVQDDSGREIGRYPPRLRPIRQRQALALLDYALQVAVEEGTGRRLAGLLSQPIAVSGKTGTTNERRDAWFVGYTRDWLGVVWTGRDDNRPASIGGASTAVPVWADLFSRLPVQNTGRTWPEGVGWYWIDWPHPTLATGDCPAARAVPFIEGSQPATLSDCIQ